MRAIDAKRGDSVQHAYYGRGVVVSDPERTELGKLSGRVHVLFDNDIPRYGTQPRIIYADRLTALGPTRMPLATAELLPNDPMPIPYDIGNARPVQMPSPGARFGGRKVGGVEIIQGGRP